MHSQLIHSVVDGMILNSFPPWAALMDVTRSLVKMTYPSNKGKWRIEGARVMGFHGGEGYLFKFGSLGRTMNFLISFLALNSQYCGSSLHSFGIHDTYPQLDEIRFCC